MHSERPKLYTILAFLSAIGFITFPRAVYTYTMQGCLQPSPLSFLHTLPQLWGVSIRLKSGSLTLPTINETCISVCPRYYPIGSLEISNFR